MASNDVKKSLDQFLDGHVTEGILTVSTQVTIRSSSLWPMQSGTALMLAKSLIKARSVVDHCVRELEHDGVDAVGNPAFAHMKYSAKSFDAQRIGDLVRKVLNRMREIQLGLNQPITIADQRPKEFASFWMKNNWQQGMAHYLFTPVVGMSITLDGTAQTLCKLQQPGTFNQFLVNWNEEQQHVWDQFKAYLEQSTVAGSVTFKTKIGKEEDAVFNGWKMTFKDGGGLKRAERKAKGGSIHLNFGMVDYCAGFSSKGVRKVALWLIHEAAHKFCGALDFGYVHEVAKYNGLSPESSLNNAESLALLALSVAEEAVMKKEDFDL